MSNGHRKERRDTGRDNPPRRGGGQQGQPDRKPPGKEHFGDGFPANVLVAPSDVNAAQARIEGVKGFLEAYGRAGKISPSQLRNIYALLRSPKTAVELRLQRPKLAYIAGKEESKAIGELVSLLDDVIQKVDEDRQLPAFRSFVESIVAYHRYFNPKES
jgi:CRISPR-associated protein Csm2